MNTAILISNTVTDEAGADKSSKMLGATSFESRTADLVLAELMRYRRVPKHNESCEANKCNQCSSMYIPKILKAVQKNEPIIMVLPAFPGKSPNSEKVLSPLPDFAEELSLSFLNQMCLNVAKIYSPGAKVLLCSDGRVFSDVVGMKEEDVSAYQNEISNIIKEKNLSELQTFNLDDHFDNYSFSQMRDELMKTYGQSMDYLKYKVRKGANEDAPELEREANRLYCGITRFLFEDNMYPGQTMSRSAVQKDAKARAYETIRRSNAWSDLIEERFPEAVRLSIHPQTCGSTKFGIRLIGNESWMTPWHGVVLQRGESYSLVKNAEAKKMGAELVLNSMGKASHYRLSLTQIKEGEVNELQNI